MTSLSWLTTRNSISNNPVDANITTNSHGADFAWAVFAVQVVVFACNALAWYAMASNLGAVPVTVEWYQGSWAGRGSGIDGAATRSIWIPRYIDWLISTPFIIIATLLVTPVPLSTIFMTVFIETVTVTCGLAGALTLSQYKWGWFVFGMCGLAWVCWVFAGPGLLAAKKAGRDVFWAYVPQVAGFGLWLILYVVCWCVSDASNLISPDSEFIYYGVLDLIAKAGCLSYYVFVIRDVDYDRFGLFSSKASLFAAAQLPAGQPAAGPENNTVGAPKQTQDVTTKEVNAHLTTTEDAEQQPANEA